MKPHLLPLGLFFLLAACGGGGPPTGAVAPQKSTPTPDVHQLMDAFRNLNTTNNRRDASNSVLYEAQSFGTVTVPTLDTASAVYVAFDQGLKALIFPDAMKADVATLLRADALVEADYQSAVQSHLLGLPQTALATLDPDVNAANAATTVLSGDLGFPPG